MYSKEQLRSIFDRTAGECHICHKKVAFKNYGEFGEHGAWEVEHSKPRAKGGTDHRNNLYAAHIKCNREKGTVTTQTARSWHDQTRAPLSREEREAAAVGAALVFAVIIAICIGLYFWLKSQQQKEALQNNTFA